MEITICVIANLFRMYIVYRFIGTFFQEKKSPRILVPVYSVYYVINTVLYLGFHLAWVNIINTFVGIVIIVSLYAKSLKKTIGISSIIYILNMICDIVATVPFREYVDGTGTSGQILFILCDFLYLLCELLAERILKVRDEGERIPLVAVPLISVAILMYMLYSGNIIGTPVVVVSIGLLFINFWVIYLYNALLLSIKKIHENELLDEKIDMYNNQISIISQSAERVLAMRHDLKNHLSEIKIMAINGKCNDIQSYINNMVLYIDNPDEIIKTGNIEMDSLLNYLIKKGKEQLCDVDIKVNIPKNVIDVFDINVVIGNLLDNAIEAASRTEEKILKGYIVQEQGILKIQLKNSYNRYNNSEKQILLDKSKVHHSGIGLKNVQKIVDKYNGIIEINKGEYFEVRVLLYMKPFAASLKYKTIE